ncbi:cilia- and flagella-associated protein 46-like isoform X1 [Rhopilema esculentum]|uniref:cilia- and flagella-associated protein 46-like isoform X1 n=1 Tax=Rhopilema esculentum TaxID=499914 RepID=UPI0031E1FC3E
MDETIKNLLSQAASGNGNEEKLFDAYAKLKRSQESTDQPNAFGAEIFVVCAEAALQNEQLSIVEDCLKMFFQKAASGNDHLGRAYICQAHLNKPASGKFPDQLEKCATFLLKAINFGKLNKRHHYLVYNGSVLYWSFARPFVQPGIQYGLAKTLHQIVKALDDIDDKDYEWRLQLMIALIECYLDGGKKEDASHVSTAAASFAKAYCPNMYKTILALQVQHKLIDQSKLLKESKLSNDLVIYIKILKLKSQIESSEKVDIDLELDKLYRAICNDGVETPGTGRSTRIGQTSSIGPISQTEKLPLLLDLARLCIECGKAHQAEDCLAATIGKVKDESVKVEIDFLKTEVAALKLKEMKNMYTKNNVEKRKTEIDVLEDNIFSAIRLKIPSLIQHGCITMWNLCLPLLQKGLRKVVKGPLKVVSEALEDIDSLLIGMRCQIHIEIAKCEEENEQLEYAMSHLKKALLLDENGQFKSRIEASLHRLELRSMLYQTPERPEDIAALIIEQARSTKEAGTLQMKRASLIEAGLTLAPDAFNLVMDGEAGLTQARGTPSNPKLLEEKVAKYCNSMTKISGHLKRIENMNDRERVQIWADLTKTARKQHVWDVTRVAAKFCLMYDDGRWEMTKRESSAKDEHKQAPNTANGNVSHETTTSKNISPPIEKMSDENKDVLGIIAEIHFIYSEALVQLLQVEGVKLLENPVPIEDSSFKPKSREGTEIKAEETKEWKIYSEWIESISTEAVHGFHRGAKLGADMTAPWFICNAGIYLWNYTNHFLAAGNFLALTKVYQPLYDSMKTIGYSEDVTFFCTFAHALAKGYMQNHLPNSRQSTPVPATEKDKKWRTGKQSASPTHSKSKAYAITNDPEALNELKQALEILEHALNLTSVADNRYMVPISTRHPLIKSWVLCKMLTGQPLPKNLGHDDENPDSQGPMSKALCAMEALVLQQKYTCDMMNCPGLFEAIKLVENCKWSDHLVEIEIWTRLAFLASKSSFCQIVLQCGEKALELAKTRKSLNYEKLNDMMKHKYKVEQELLHYTSVLMGENLVAIMHGRSEARHQALNHFFEACRFATKARNYQLAMSAAKHYWNTVQSFISTPIERKLLKEPIKALLKCIADAWKHSGFRESQDKNDDGEDGRRKVQKPSLVKSSPGAKKKEKAKPSHISKKSAASGSHVRIGEEDFLGEEEREKSSMDADLTLRASLYGVLFQAYSDTGDWINGLKAMDEAVKVMPKTHHRLLIFKHRVIMNARLGNPVQFDMGKFKDSDELLISSMWHRVARNSNLPKDQLIAYMNAIECLQSPGSEWQKVDFLSDFADWLFVNEFPLSDCLDHLEAAMDIVVDVIISKNSLVLVPRSARISDKNIKISNDNDIKTIISDCVDMQSLETLARLHIMSAQMQEGSTPKSQEYILTAAYCIQRLWQNSIRIGEKAMRDGVKPGERPFSKAESRKKDANKIDRVASKTCIPFSLEQWATFALPERLKEYFKQDVSGCFISERSIKKPELTFYYMEALNNSLCQHGYHPLCLPVCAFNCFIATEILEDKFLITLSKLQLLDILNDLEMVSASCNLSRSLGPQYITEEDKAESREKVLIWKEKEAQVYAEESKHVMEIKANKPSTKQKDTTRSSGNRRLIGGLTRREIWTRIAAFLIKQGQYNDARELLEEARRSAEGFKDDHCLAQIEFNSAVLAYQECDWGTAISHLERIQNLEGSLEFWCKVIALKVDAYYRSLAIPTTFQCHPEIASSDKALEILTSSIRLLDDLSRKSPNRFCQSVYVKAVLHAKLADYILKTSSVIDDKKNQEIFQLLDESLENFTSLGCNREVLRILKSQCILLQSSISSSSREKRKTVLIQCFEIARKAIAIAKKNESRVKKATFEIGNACLPVEMELAETVLHAMKIAVTILGEVTNDIQMRQASQCRKGSMNKILEDFVSMTPAYTESQRDWNLVTGLIGEEALSLLTQIYNSKEKIPKSQAKAAFFIGKCLQQLALQIFPGLEEYTPALQQGSEKASVANIAITEKFDDSEAVDNLTDLDVLSSMDSRKRQKALQIKKNYAEYAMFITQAVEFLTQACQIGLRNGCKDIIAHASYSIVQCIGNRDPATSLHYLALYQSASAAITLSDTAQRVLTDPHTSRIAGLTQQRKSLNDMAVNSNDSLGVRAINLELLQTESEAWRRLHISRNHVDITKEIPFPVTFVILQHSPDKSLLYAGVLEKPRVGMPTGKKKDQTVGAANRSHICSTPVSQELLLSLIAMAEQFKNDVSSFLLHKNYFQQQTQKRKEMLGLVERSSNSISKETLFLKAELENEEKQLQTRFDEMVVAMEAYCGTIIPQLQESLTQEPAVERLVILADADLHKLPLEALPVFANSDIRSISRDFSLQIFHHRITQGELAEQQNGNGDRSKVAKKEKVDTKSKSDKAMGNNRKVKGMKEFVFGKDGIYLDLSNLRYIVDPSCEWPSGDKDAPSSVMLELVQQLKNKAAKWTSLNGHDDIPSVTEMQKFLQESQSWIFYGSENLLAHIPPHLLAPISLNDCHLILLMDNMRTITSALNQGKLDAQKSPADLALERPLDTAILLSLCGAPCLVLNQWQCEAHNNKERLHHLILGICEKTNTVGQALQSSRCTSPGSAKQKVAHEDDSISEKANSSQGKRKILQHRSSRPESLRSNKVSSAGSQGRGEKLSKLKPDAIINEQNEGSDGIATGDPTRRLFTFELYNTVLYGLPNFTTTLQSGGS